MNKRVCKKVLILSLLFGLSLPLLTLVACEGDPLVAPFVNDPLDNDSKESGPDPEN